MFVQKSRAYNIDEIDGWNDVLFETAFEIDVINLVHGTRTFVP